ncbi:hypothetical protein HID58_087064 [Brassica napus]|uniref:Replication factor A C-terminal domain-containing protein n=2 Tax=Brassica napus TaxID=3708 RepID=A0ABQ7XS88_BRANA|nr:hypothetical protein HID58_087064 [Brassica napus]
MSKMKLAFTPVAQLKPDSEKEIWKIKVRVVRMWRFQNGIKPGDGRSSRRIWEKENVVFSPNLGNYRGTPHPFKIFFTWSTHVKKNCEEIPNDSFRFNCISFDDLLSQKHDEIFFIDVIREIVGPCDLKEITVRNAPCKILNLQLKDCGVLIINCVFWKKNMLKTFIPMFNHFLVELYLMRINIYNGKFTIQSGKASTKLFDIAEINEFKEKMSKDVMATTSCGSLLTLSNCTQVSSDHIPFVNRKTISQLLTSYEKVNPYLNPETEEIEMDKFSCDGCETIVCSTKTRYQVHCKVLDHTGTTSFVMFDREAIQLIHKSAYELLEQQVQFNSGNEFPRELLALEGREFVFTINKPETSKNYTPSTFKTDIPAIGPHFSNYTETTMSLVNDVFEESNNSISASTESTSTPTKKRASTLAIEDCVPQISSKKLKGDISLLAEEDGQLSSTKSKPKVGHVTKDDCAKPSSTKQRKAANLIPKKEKN